jgi:hypothetical protein
MFGLALQGPHVPAMSWPSWRYNFLITSIAAVVISQKERNAMDVSQCSKIVPYNGPWRTREQRAIAIAVVLFSGLDTPN